MPAFELEHSRFEEFANIFEPQSTQHFDSTFSSFENLLENQDYWDENDEGEPCPVTKAINCTPQNWYTEYWNFCTFAHQSADLDGTQFREICNYEPVEDWTIYSGDPFDYY